MKKDIVVLKNMLCNVDLTLSNNCHAIPFPVGKGKYDDEQYIETLEKVQKYFVKQKATNEIPKTVVVTTTTGNEQIPLVFEGKTAGLNDDQLGVPLKGKFIIVTNPNIILTEASFFSVFMDYLCLYWI